MHETRTREDGVIEVRYPMDGPVVALIERSFRESPPRWGWQVVGVTFSTYST